MKLFLDTNVVVDFYAQRDPFFSSAWKIIELAERGLSTIQAVDVGAFIKKHPHPQYNSYLNENKFKKFKISFRSSIFQFYNLSLLILCQKKVTMWLLVMAVDVFASLVPLSFLPSQGKILPQLGVNFYLVREQMLRSGWKSGFVGRM